MYIYTSSWVGNTALEEVLEITEYKDLNNTDLSYFSARQGSSFPNRAAQDAPLEPTWTYLRRVRKRRTLSRRKMLHEYHSVISKAIY